MTSVHAEPFQLWFEAVAVLRLTIPPNNKPAVVEPILPAWFLPVLKSAISVQAVPLYCSTKSSYTTPGVDPPAIIVAVFIPNPVTPLLAVFVFPPLAHVPIGAPPSLTALNCPDVEL